MNQSMFIVWRESVEALLVIGILQAWISRQAGHAQVRRGHRALPKRAPAWSSACCFAGHAQDVVRGDR